MHGKYFSAQKLTGLAEGSMHSLIARTSIDAGWMGFQWQGRTGQRVCGESLKVDAEVVYGDSNTVCCRGPEDHAPAPCGRFVCACTPGTSMREDQNVRDCWDASLSLASDTDRVQSSPFVFMSLRKEPPVSVAGTRKRVRTVASAINTAQRVHSSIWWYVRCFVTQDRMQQSVRLHS